MIANKFLVLLMDAEINQEKNASFFQNKHAELKTPFT